jgi:hypothetical protein
MDTSASLYGIYRDTLVGPGGHILEDRGWVKNTIVDRCRVLLAGFVAGAPTSGIQYLALGQGNAAWDAEGTPGPDPARTTALEDGAPYRIEVADLAIAYLDANDEVVGRPTTRIQVTATLPDGIPEPESPANSYPLREFGLFGHFDNADFMINSIRHPVIHKDENATLIRVIRLYF